MATHKVVVLQNNKRKNGSMPVCIRVTHNAEPVYLKTPYSVMPQQLGRSGEIKDSFLRQKVNLVDAEVTKLLDDLGFRIAQFPTAKGLKLYLEQKLNKSTPDSGSIDFFVFAHACVEKMKQAGRRKTAANYASAIRNIEAFLGRSTDLNFNEITAMFCRKYYNYMVSSQLGERGRELYLSCLRRIFNEAVLEYNDYDTGDLLIKTNPFVRFKIPAPTFANNAEKRALPMATMRQIFNAPTETWREELAKDVYFLSFCLCGMNAADLYSCTKIEGNRITYFRAKTKARRSDGAEMRITVPPEAERLLKKYKGESTIFNFSERYSSVDNFNRAVNFGLHSIGKKCEVERLTLYSARHSWATIAANDLGIDEKLVDECLAHAPIHKMLHKYVKKDWTKIDTTNRKVLDYVFNFGE